MSPVDKIEYRGKEYKIPINPEKGAGDVTALLKDEILGIQEGTGKDTLGWSKLLN